jgi:hypothetical protein
MGKEVMVLNLRHLAGIFLKGRNLGRPKSEYAVYCRRFDA